MENLCNQCYMESYCWGRYGERFSDACINYKYFKQRCLKCTREALYKVGDKVFCEDCLLKKIGVEIRPRIINDYYLDNVRVGNDKDYEIEELIKLVCPDITKIN